jgi:hypothetical protein
VFWSSDKLEEKKSVSATTLLTKRGMKNSLVLRRFEEKYLHQHRIWYWSRRKFLFYPPLFPAWKERNTERKKWFIGEFRGKEAKTGFT